LGTFGTSALKINSKNPSKALNKREKDTISITFPPKGIHTLFIKK